MADPPSPPPVSAQTAQSWQHADEVAALAGTAAGALTGRAHDLLKALLALALARGPVKAASGSIRDLIDFREWFAAQVEQVGRSLPDPLRLIPALEGALRLGAHQAVAESGAPPLAQRELTLDAQLLGRLSSVRIRQRGFLSDADALISLVRDRGDVVKAFALASRAVTYTDQAASGLVHDAARSGMDQVAVADGWSQIWQGERNACFVASTRVLAPSVLADHVATPSVVVAADPLDGFTLHPSTLGIREVGDPSLLSTAAVARPIRDRFREVQAVSRREFVGDLVNIRTATGKELTGTPNHPVATRRGWVELGKLQVGDYVFSRASTQHVPPGVHPDDDYAPPSIEKVAEALPLAMRVVPVAAKDLNGDIADSDVDVVRPHGLLLGDLDTSAPKHGREASLDRRDVQLARLGGLGALGEGGLGSSPATVSRSGKGSNLPPALGSELMAAAQVAPGFDSGQSEPLADRHHVDAIDYGDFLKSLAPFVEADEIVDVRRSDFSGHVYNLQTIEGWYIAESIVVHNCIMCQSMQGAIAGPPDFVFMPTILGSWLTPAIYAGLHIPAHPNCRCRPRLVRADQPHVSSVMDPGSLTNVLQREARRSIVLGLALPSESQAARRRAASELLARRGGARLPKTVEQRARRRIASGQFRTRPVITTGSK